MSQPEKTGILYEQIIARVIEDSRERLESEGADLQVLGELQKVSTVRVLELLCIAGPCGFYSSSVAGREIFPAA
jgi:hypothetical protein